MKECDFMKRNGKCSAACERYEVSCYDAPGQLNRGNTITEVILAATAVMLIVWVILI